MTAAQINTETGPLDPIGIWELLLVFGIAEIEYPGWVFAPDDLKQQSVECGE